MILAFTTTAWQSFAGHLLYGLLLGGVSGLTLSRIERTDAGRRAASSRA